MHLTNISTRPLSSSSRHFAVEAVIRDLSHLTVFYTSFCDPPTPSPNRCSPGCAMTCYLLLSASNEVYRQHHSCSRRWPRQRAVVLQCTRANLPGTKETLTAGSFSSWSLFTSCRPPFYLCTGFLDACARVFISSSRFCGVKIKYFITGNCFCRSCYNEWVSE